MTGKEILLKAFEDTNHSYDCPILCVNCEADKPCNECVVDTLFSFKYPNGNPVIAILAEDQPTDWEPGQTSQLFLQQVGWRLTEIEED